MEKEKIVPIQNWYPKSLKEKLLSKAAQVYTPPQPLMYATVTPALKGTLAE
jgi:hypothetical protein